MDIGQYAVAETYFQKAVSCSKFYEFEHDIDLARSLSGLSYSHSSRNEFKLAQPLAAAASRVATR